MTDEDVTEAVVSLDVYVPPATSVVEVDAVCELFSAVPVSVDVEDDDDEVVDDVITDEVVVVLVSFVPGVIPVAVVTT